MAERIIIYDPDLEVAAIVNVDTRMADGPAMVGPNARDILQAFMDSVPFDLDLLSTYDRSKAFAQFLERVGVAATPDTTTPDTDTMAAGTNTGVDETALAEHTATESRAEPPPEAPSDTDTPPPVAVRTEKVRCWNCNGEGVIRFGDDSPDQTCNMCGGTGKVTQEVPA